jgi:hypothetical protein
VHAPAAELGVHAEARFEDLEKVLGVGARRILERLIVEKDHPAADAEFQLCFLWLRRR